jgi:hypothetical protein
MTHFALAKMEDKNTWINYNAEELKVKALMLK